MSIAFDYEGEVTAEDAQEILENVISVIKGSLELWPALIEICYFRKGRKGLPQLRVNNQRKLAA